MADKANGVQDALAQIMALPGFPFGGPMFASDLCDHDEDGEAVNDDWGYESRNLIASCVNFVCEHFAELAALEAKLEAAERERDEALAKIDEASDVLLSQYDRANEVYDEGIRLNDDSISDAAVERIAAMNPIGMALGCLVLDAGTGSGSADNG